jgi:multiple sugar transport system substrate-binding protein
MKVQRFLMLVIGLAMLAIVVVTTFPKAAMAEEPIELSLWGGWPEIEPIYQEVAAAYKKDHPNVTIKVLTSPLREFEQKLSATIPADTAACIIEASPYPMQKFLVAGLIPPAPANVVEFMTASGRFPEALVKDNLGEDGNYYGINFFQGRHVIYWNKDKFKAAGLANPPGTMEELVAYAQKLAQRDGDKLTSSGVSLRLSGGGSGVGEKFWMYLFPNGGSIIEKTPSGKWHNGYNNEAGRKTVQMYLDLVWKYKADSHEIKHDAEAFELGQTAMFVRESWVIGDAAKKAPNLNFGTAPMPKGKRWGDLATGVNLYVTRTCKHSDVAWDFILFLNSEENLQKLLKKTGWLPQRLDIDLSPVLDETPQYRSFLFSDPNYQIYTYPTLPEFDEILTKFAERLVNAFLDKSLVDNPDGVAKLLQEAAAETDAILKRNGHYGTD